uniref:Zinc finger GRF-type domain-containing protein n=1 Tax=Brassica oleracea var. oleracea TaxID=109376 RepID=A0A0D3DA45_BRAOL
MLKLKLSQLKASETKAASYSKLLRATPLKVYNRGVDVTRRKAERESFLSFSRKNLGFSRRSDFPCDADLSPLFSPFLDRFDAGLSPPGAEMDPAEERRDSKRQQEYLNHLGNVADSEYGMPRRCAYGGRMIDELRVKDEFDTQPGKRFFSCVNYEADGFHYRQPWVIGVREEIVSLRKRVEEADEVIKHKLKGLTLLLDKLTGDVYNLTVQVVALENVCFD